MLEILRWVYPLSQTIIFLLYIPVIRQVARSETADAINVPAQFAFFVIGGIAALYMVVANGDYLSGGIICGHIFIGNLPLAVIALVKQRRAKKLK
jgi:hypothetical protein